MKKRTREKIALVFLVVLVVGLLSAIVAYISMMGRPWNVAASVVDEASGRMEGYTVLVYAGTASRAQADVPRTGASARTPSSLGPDGSSVSSGDRQSTLKASDRPDVMDSFALTLLSFLAAPSVDEPLVTVSDVRDVYERKNATVFTLDTLDPARYEQPSVLRVGEKSLGIFYADTYLTAAQIRAYADDLKERGADALVCIAPRAAYIADNDALDAVVITGDGGRAASEDEEEGSVRFFRVHAPTVDEVGVIVLSPNNTPTSKTITML